MNRIRRMKDRLRWPTLLETFTISAVFYALYLGEIISSLTLAILALAWSEYHGEIEE